MREMTWEQMDVVDGGGWMDFVKGVACAGMLIGAFYISGPLGVRVVAGIAAGAGCAALYL